mmetsp:Transcript_22575/g.37257  ORF Transcript_22575/g.37257 Transcript_22575/m.37257 type:complete len:211 (-) Transcript_22575:414-1046(-)|eukprot:CAMPEP_0184354102 /NCGR_PEP_ID=MMETSP1089-20130417/85243_1 /TAXON_ID=38269 ORGANISM="Gloeochaete wittrockiana, Strain SAG46.84" /NCGR_SAMPLE_ID=MMETSP1089 /ASSEMBLY_ACC=CAM_ASM_000445 /LENGTH=210 /DNA_ID=CAMNT_0026689913 /DNA_START=70 /DNA_END=702 /DNA_ORIENTATION=-
MVRVTNSALENRSACHRNRREDSDEELLPNSEITIVEIVQSISKKGSTLKDHLLVGGELEKHKPLDPLWKAQKVDQIQSLRAHEFSDDIEKEVTALAAKGSQIQQTESKPSNNKNVPIPDMISDLNKNKQDTAPEPQKKTNGMRSSIVVQREATTNTTSDRGEVIVDIVAKSSSPGKTHDKGHTLGAHQQLAEFGSKIGKADFLQVEEFE